MRLLHRELHVHLIEQLVGRKSSQFYFGCSFWQRNGRNKLMLHSNQKSTKFEKY